MGRIYGVGNATGDDVLDKADELVRGKSEPVIGNREEWLTNCVNELRPLFKRNGYKVPDVVRVSVGWPSSGGLSTKAPTIGQCWGIETTGDKTAQIFITPVLADSVTVADVLVHELGHVVCGAKCGHRGAFVKFCNAVGLEGKPTATHAGDKLKAELGEIVERIGEYPHAAIKATGKAKQKGRFINVQCPECGYNMYTTRKWLELGTPTCVCGALMLSEDEMLDDDFGDLVPVGHALDYRTKDGRFEVRYIKEPRPGWTRGEKAWWHVIDFEAHAVRASVLETHTEYILDAGPARTTTLYTRHDALAFIEAVRTGMHKYAPLEADDDVTLDPGIDFDHLDDDEAEEHDYPDENDDYEHGIDEYPAPVESEVQ